MYWRMSMKTKRLLSIGLMLGCIVALSGCFLFTTTGTVTGVVIDATNGSGISGVVVTVIGDSFYSATTDSFGAFSFFVPIGNQTLSFDKPGYQFSSVSVVVVANEETEIRSSRMLGNPVLTSGETRFVLTWGATPSDLDSHLLTPSGDHVYFGDRNPSGAGANLDLDDTSSYGPETITITASQSGTYIYYVYKWSSAGSLTTSDAEVKVYDSTGLVETISVPTSGTGDYWNVASLNGSTLTVVNSIVSSAPTQ